MGNALLIVASASSPTAGDSFLQNRLQDTHGHTVTLRSASAGEDVTGQDFVIIAESPSSSAVGTKYKDVPIPVYVMEAGLIDEQEFATASTLNRSIIDTVNIVTQSHPTAATLTAAGNPHQIFPNGVGDFGAIPTANLAAGAVNVANDGADSGSVITAIESGNLRADGTNAPARRLYFGIWDDALYDDLNADGLALLNAGIDWIEGTETHTAPADVSGGGALVVDVLKHAATAADVTGGGDAVVGSAKRGAASASISGGGTLAVYASKRASAPAGISGGGGPVVTLDSSVTHEVVADVSGGGAPVVGVRKSAATAAGVSGEGDALVDTVKHSEALAEVTGGGDVMATFVDSVEGWSLELWPVAPVAAGSWPRAAVASASFPEASVSND